MSSPELNFGARFGPGPHTRESVQVLTNEWFERKTVPRKDWGDPCIRKAHECVSHDGLGRETSEGDGACSPLFTIRSHLPLRGKLGWMTPRVGVKTTLTTKRTLRGPRSQAGASFFCSLPPYLTVNTERLHHSVQSRRKIEKMPQGLKPTFQTRTRRGSSRAVPNPRLPRISPRLYLSGWTSRIYSKGMAQAPSLYFLPRRS